MWGIKYAKRAKKIIFEFRTIENPRIDVTHDFKWCKKHPHPRGIILVGVWDTLIRKLR